MWKGRTQRTTQPQTLVGRSPLLQPWPTQTSRAGYGSRALQTKKNHTNNADPNLNKMAVSNCLDSHHDHPSKCTGATRRQEKWARSDAESNA